MSWLRETKRTGQPRAEWGPGRHSPRQMLSKALLEQLEKFAQRRCGSPASPASSEPQEAPGPEGVVGSGGSLQGEGGPGTGAVNLGTVPCLPWASALLPRRPHS